MAKLAIYPGSFDPPTLGHIDIIERASTLFQTLRVSVGSNSEKAPYFSVEDRLDALRESTSHLANVVVGSFDGLLVQHARDHDCRVLVRGLRAISDFEYEFRIAMANRSLAPEVESVFLITRDEYSFLASSVVREVARLGGDYSGFVPEAVARRIESKLAESRGDLNP